eukprot:6349808-Alexandrium_andersonii.AAC.1
MKSADQGDQEVLGKYSDEVPSVKAAEDTVFLCRIKKCLGRMQAKIHFAAHPSVGAVLIPLLNVCLLYTSDAADDM